MPGIDSADALTVPADDKVLDATRRFHKSVIALLMTILVTVVAGLGISYWNQWTMISCTQEGHECYENQQSRGGEIVTLLLTEIDKQHQKQLNLLAKLQQQREEPNG